MSPGMAARAINCGRRFAAVLVGLFSTFQNLGIYFILTPLNRLVELSICREYYDGHDPTVIDHGDVPESLCKLKPIQSELAALIGLISILGLVNEMLVTIPLGYVSDRVGRKFVLLLNAISCILVFGWVMLVGYAYSSFSIKAIIAGPFFYLIGGSVNVFNANAFAIIADVSKDILERTAIFGYFQAIGQGLRLLTPALTAVIMTKNLWIPFWIGITCFALSIPVILLLPDTRVKPYPKNSGNAPVDGEENGHAQPGNEGGDDPERGHGVGDEEACREDSPLLEGSSKPPGVEGIQAAWRRARHEIWEFGQLIFSTRNATLNFAVFLVTTLARTVLNVFVQYVSYRYHWTIAQTGYLLTFKAALSVFLYVALIPSFLWLLTKRANFSKEAADLCGAKISITQLGVGALLMGFSPVIWMFIISLIIYVLGSGLTLFMISLLTTDTFKHINQQHTGRLYAAVFLVESVGELAGIPILSSAMIGGINIGGYGVGLPFFICAGAYFLASFAVWNLRVGENLQTE